MSLVAESAAPLLGETLLGGSFSAPALLHELRRSFDADFSLFDSASGDVLHRASGQPPGVASLTSSLATAVAARTTPELLAEEEGAAVLALPIAVSRRWTIIAAAAFATRPLAAGERPFLAARLLELPVEDAASWLGRQKNWTPHALLRLAEAVLERMRAERRVRRLEGDVEKISGKLASTYEELTLLYDVTQNLRISQSDEDLGRLTLSRLSECVPACGIGLLYLPVSACGDAAARARTAPTLIAEGEFPLGSEQLLELIAALKHNPQDGPLVANSPRTGQPGWPMPSVGQLVVAPLMSGERLVGWLAAVNHRDEAEFGTIEASLLNSVAAILAIHSDNVELFRQQREFVRSMMRTLTWAIEAKDPYTCGHSDRVARISVRLGQELGLDEPTLQTLYMAGLVHDIGKIGVSDEVLRKPDQLSDGEFEEIKRHPELGHKILAELHQLADALPVVLHHHEEWDGTGYPHGLAGESIPWLARICAVADAYDAMTSDRPYRRGMPLEKVNSILRAGAGSQWDAQVVEAYFRAHDDILEISRRERDVLMFDVTRLLTANHPPSSA